MKNEMLSVFQETKDRRAAEVNAMKVQLKQLFSLVQPMTTRWERTLRKNAADFYSVIKYKYLGDKYWAKLISDDSLSMSIGSTTKGNYFTFTVPGLSASGTFLSLSVDGECDGKIHVSTALKRRDEKDREKTRSFPLPSSLLGTRPDEYGRECSLQKDDMALILAHKQEISSGMWRLSAEKKIIDAMKQYLRNLAGPRNRDD